LRIFSYHSMELTAFMKSYFGGLMCLAWSPDARYIATGGEDDLITVYSVIDKRVICRGQGHRSWISKVAFDPYTSYATDSSGHAGIPVDLGSDEDLRPSSLNSSGLLFKS
uniref:WD_REPEATS_REGION domain-containing protein n=1 Tax=Gongylonema pulchrum TaxID=637853 RepID=A0A183D0E3_9BILA